MEEKWEMNAIIVLHEIYGKNTFIEEECKKYEDLGFDVYCPNIYEGKVFSYIEADVAYSYFGENVGFDIYHLIWKMIDELSKRYEAIYVIGYSVGATLAWLCCENPNCKGIIAYYGSRIRDYLYLQPKCLVLLIFAEKDSFDVVSVSETLSRIPNIEIMNCPAEHGFMDYYSLHYDVCQSAKAENKTLDFISSCAI